MSFLGEIWVEIINLALWREKGGKRTVAAGTGTTAARTGCGWG